VSIAVALAAMLSFDDIHNASPARLADIWQSYRYAEYDARGGYICDPRQHRLVSREFQQRFGRRAVALQATIRQRLDKSAVDAELVVVSVCMKLGSDASLRSWATANFKTYETELAAAEQAFGLAQGAH
jgi:hypothetical protein